MPRRDPKPYPEKVLRKVWDYLMREHMGFARRGTREQIMAALDETKEFSLYPPSFWISERGLRQVYDQLIATNRIVCSTSEGTYIPTTEEEFQRGFRYRHSMAVKLLETCSAMKRAWEAWRLTADVKRGAALPTADVEARAS